MTTTELLGRLGALHQQRDAALNQVAMQAGQIALLVEELTLARQRIAELEYNAPPPATASHMDSLVSIPEGRAS